MNITILGSGCANCKKLEINVNKAIDELHTPIPVQKEGDYSKIASYGVMQTPALVIGDKVIFQGRIPGIDELKAIISREISG